MTATAATLRLPELELLFEESPQADLALPGELQDAYGGSPALAAPRLCVNFVSTLDGVVALPDEVQSSHLIAAGSEADRFVMGLLRAQADVVLVGAGTLHGSPRSRWTAERAYPPAAPLYAELRRGLGLAPQPTLAVLSGSGRLDPGHPGLDERSLVLTSERGAARLRRRLPDKAEVVPLGAEGPLDVGRAVELLRARGHGLILCEGGPTVFGALVGAGLVDDLFLTVSPLLAGRGGGDSRLALVEEAAFLPGRKVEGRLVSLRRAGSHLFLRYAL
ncbi:MAG TPA: dihydrofolate reductase family protein [Gaiellaceae bacterium]|nr:dihydrofolate reductase family protein [Gaiellaceae bacterium]